MAVFRYRMQNILNLKRKLEDQEKLVFAQARAALDRENERMAQLEGKKEGYEQVLKGELTDSLNGNYPASGWDSGASVAYDRTGKEHPQM